MSNRRGGYDPRGHDRRERSPNGGYATMEQAQYNPRRPDERRDVRRDERHDDRGRGRGGYDRARSDQDRGRGGQHRGYGSYSAGPSSASNLPQLPTVVPIPKAMGDELPVTMSRPAGRAGQPIEVFTNHYAVQSLPVIKIYQFELRFALTPESIRGTGNTQMSPALIERAFQAANKVAAFGPFAVFNGTSLLWSPEELVTVGETASKRVSLSDHSQQRPNQVQIDIRNIGKVRVANIVNKFTDSPNADIEAGLVWLNALLRAFPASKDWFARPKGLSFFIREPGLFMPLESTGGVLEALRGLHQAISTHWNMLSVNVDIATTAFYTPDKPLNEVLLAFAGLPPNSPPDALLRPGVDLRYLSEKISGISFYVTHDTQERRAKVIKAKGLHFKDGQIGTAINSLFMRLDPATGLEAQTSVLQYFQDKYQTLIRFPTLPLVDTRIGLFPLEFCRTAPGFRYREVLEGQQTADFIRFATAPAHQRMNQIEECVKRLEWHNQLVLPAHGVSIHPHMLKVPAVLLRPPPVRYAQTSASVNNGAWNLRGVKFVNPKPLDSWGCLYMPRGGRPGAINDRDIEQFFQTMHRAMRNYGLMPPDGPPAVVVSQLQADVKPIIAAVAKETCKQFRVSQPAMIFILLHQGMPTSVYKAVKSCCEVEYGIPSQVLLVEKSIRGKGNPAQYCGNVCLKVNSKLGGQNSAVPLPGRFRDGGCMIVGADVTHPTPAQLRIVPTPPSIAALTGTFDRDCMRYTAVASPQQSTQESISAGASMPVFVSMFDTLVQRFRDRNNGCPPNNVIYFRDGVADSQMEELTNGEVKLIKEEIAKFGGKLPAIVAQKRHHTRFFPIGRSNDRNGNIEPGTVVESGPESAFVCGHGALQGTVRPSHFRILRGADDNNFSPDEFHELIMHGCHSYSKATRAVHTHASIYYADIVAERSTARFRQSGDQAYFVDVHDSLKNSMWWL